MFKGEDEKNDAPESPKVRATVVAIIRNEINEKYDALTQSFRKIRSENATMAVEMFKLKNHIQLLETKNDKLINHVCKLSQRDGEAEIDCEIDSRLGD